METGMEPVSNPPAAEHPTQEVGGEDEHAEGRASAATGAAPHPWDGYLTGPENELAMAAAQAMARGERDGISPLVVHGPSGVGKSRLLAGLVAEWLRRQPGSPVAHLDAHAFGSACLEAAGEAAGSGWSALRGRFRCVGLFVLEDLEGLERAPLARDELAHTLDALDASGAAVAVSARSAPGTWPRLEWPVRLINRLLGGLAVRIAPPGLASRRRYVLHHATQHGVALQADAVETLAQAADGYRPLDGWITRLALEDRLNRARRQGRGSGSSHAAQWSTAALTPALWVDRARSAHGCHHLGRGNSPGRSACDHRCDYPSRGHAVRSPARCIARAEPPGVSRHGPPPGHASGPDTRRFQFPCNRDLLRRSRPGHRSSCL